MATRRGHASEVIGERGPPIAQVHGGRQAGDGGCRGVGDGGAPSPVGSCTRLALEELGWVEPGTWPWPEGG